MKKYIITLVLSVIIANAFAQHLSFVGIQLGQFPNRTDVLLKQKGFKFVGVNNVMGTRMYDGTFWRFNNARVNTQVENGKVTAITLSPDVDTYNDIYYYNDLVNSMDKKYGKHRSLNTFSQSDFFYCTDGCYWKLQGGYVFAYYAQNSMTGKIIICMDYYDNTSNLIMVERGRKRNTNNDL